MGEENRKRERTVSEADKALKSPRPTVGGKSLESVGMQGVQVADLFLSDSSGSSEETTSSDSSDSAGDIGWCRHMRLDSESIEMGVNDIKNSKDLPTCYNPDCGITWKGAGKDKEGMMKCIDCPYISCAQGMDGKDPRRGHAILHALDVDHYIAQWYDEPSLGYCFRCHHSMRLSGNQDQWSKDECAKVDKDVKDEWETVASKTKDQRGMVASKTKDQRGMVVSNTKDDSGIGVSNAKDDSGIGVSNAKVDWVMAAGDGAAGHVSGYATGDGYVIKGMPNYGSTCYMNASLQCLLALGKMRAKILQRNARLGNIGLLLKELFVDTDSTNNATRILDPEMILVCMQSFYQNRFQAGNMEDSHEFLISLHNALDTEVVELNLMHVNQGGNDVFPTFGHSIFSGKLINTVSCRSCSHNAVTRIDFTELILPLQPMDPPPPARSIAECGNSQIPGLRLGDGAIEETPNPLQVDSTEVKDVVQSGLETQKNDVPREIIEEPIALDYIPNLFDDTEGMEESTEDSYNPEDEKAQSSDIVYVESGHMDRLASIEDYLRLFSHQLKNCENCSKVVEAPETNGSKNVETIMASTNVNATIDGDQTELSDRKTCPSEPSSDLSSLSVGKSCGEKALVSCSTANEKVESHEGVAPSCLPADKQTDLLSAQEIQDTSTQKQGSGKQVIYDQQAGNGGAIQTQLISKLPPVLTIQLMRYTPGSKLKGHVSFKEILHFGPFMDPSSEDKDNSSYRLVGVIVHYGNTRNGGHYIAYVRGSGSSWFRANDRDITVVSLEEVLRCEAYILFYERIED